MSVLDTCVPKALAWGRVLTMPSWWASPGEDRGPFRSGVEPAYRTRRQVRRSGLCRTCWFNESDPRFCDGGRCPNAECRNVVVLASRRSG
ncbi:hypothetical protein [Streptomyces sp. Inha503]|uniref:hypothetical protein n=1 Tax=Streptomyces sp. Inha503 TaxID=3383314 RepID=UPI0039A2EFC1